MSFAVLLVAAFLAGHAKGAKVYQLLATTTKDIRQDEAFRLSSVDPLTGAVVQQLGDLGFKGVLPNSLCGEAGQLVMNTIDLSTFSNVIPTIDLTGQTLSTFQVPGGTAVSNLVCGKDTVYVGLYDEGARQCYIGGLKEQNLSVLFHVEGIQAIDVGLMAFDSTTDVLYFLSRYDAAPSGQGLVGYDVKQNITSPSQQPLQHYAEILMSHEATGKLFTWFANETFPACLGEVDAATGITVNVIACSMDFSANGASSIAHPAQGKVVGSFVGYPQFRAVWAVVDLDTGDIVSTPLDEFAVNLAWSEVDQIAT